MEILRLYLRKPLLKYSVRSFSFIKDKPRLIPKRQKLPSGITTYIGNEVDIINKHKSTQFDGGVESINTLRDELNSSYDCEASMFVVSSYKARKTKQLRYKLEC